MRPELFWHKADGCGAVGVGKRVWRNLGLPTYVYECKKCEKVFEAEQRITEDPLKDCDCGAKGSLRRVIQPVGVVFSGPGFHINDYAASTSSPASASKSDEKAEVKTETKTDVKPETKSEPKPETKKAPEKRAD